MSKKTPKHAVSAKSSPTPGDSSVPPFRLEFYVDDEGREVVRDWLRSLSLRKRQVLGAAMLKMLQPLGVGVCETEFGRPLGGGLFEFRLRQDPGAIIDEKGRRVPPEKILLRVFCHAYGDKVVLLLGGYDKGEDPRPKRQRHEIEEARRRLAAWKRR